MNGSARFIGTQGLSAEAEALVAGDLASTSLMSVAVALTLMLCTLTAANFELALPLGRLNALSSLSKSAA